MKPILIGKLHRLSLFFCILPKPKLFFASLFIVLTFLGTSPFVEAANYKGVQEVEMEICSPSSSTFKAREKILTQLPEEDLKKAVMPIHNSILGDLQAAIEQIHLLPFQELKLGATRDDLEAMILNNMHNAASGPYTNSL